MGKYSHVGAVRSVGKYKVTINSKNTKEYDLWNAMLSRCYCERELKRFQSYLGCTVSENFKDFQYFANWCNNQIGFGAEKYCLDKDVIKVNNKVYSENTCCFIPAEINNFFLRGISGKNGYKAGVYYHIRDNKFVAQISLGSGKSTHLGYFETEDAAHLAYYSRKERHAKELAEKFKG